MSGIAVQLPNTASLMQFLNTTQQFPTLGLSDFACDHQALDIRSAFVNLADAYITINTLYREVRDIAITPLRMIITKSRTTTCCVMLTLSYC